MTRRTCLLATIGLALVLALAGPSLAASTAVSIQGTKFAVNGAVTHPGTPVEGMLLNSRMVQGVLDDENPQTVGRWAYPDTGVWDPERNTDELVAALPSYAAKGLGAITVNLQGGRPVPTSDPLSSTQPWIVSAFRADASLKPAWLARLGRLLDAADRSGIVVILGLFYHGQDQRLADDNAVKRGVDNVVDWLLAGGYTNVLVEVGNESNASSYDRTILRKPHVHQLIERVQVGSVGALAASTSFTGGVLPTAEVVAQADYVLLHGNNRPVEAIAPLVRDVRAMPAYQAEPKPIIFNEDSASLPKMDAAIGAGASWGYYDSTGFQALPVNWGITTGTKRAFFDRVASLTGASTTAPLSTSEPMIAGTAEEGSLLTADNGGWTGSQPIAYTYEWLRCDNLGAACNGIAGAAGKTYTLTANDVGSTVRVALTASNGSGLSSATSAQTPVVQANPETGQDPVVMAAGDIACGSKSVAACRHMATSELVVQAQPDEVLALGDLQYECGQASEFQAFYDPSWGRMKARTHPVPGNHEYETSTASTSACFNAPAGARGYYEYFGEAATPREPTCVVNCEGYYSWDLGDWHLVALNSNCARVGGCGAGSPQETWLRNDLKATQKSCILAYWHHPRHSSGKHGSTANMQAIWADLYDVRADVVLSGHDHDYERFDLLGTTTTTDSAGTVHPVVDPNGIREFVVGTGGKGLRPFSKIRNGSLVRNADTLGVLKLTLHAASYEWEFVPEPGGTFTDSGSTTCH